jgi:hypothetical protein
MFVLLVLVTILHPPPQQTGDLSTKFTLDA